MALISGKIRWLFRGSLRRMLASLMLIIIFPMLLLQLGIYYSWFEVQKKRILEDNLVMARSIAQTINSVIRDETSQELDLGTVMIQQSQPDTANKKKLLKISADEDQTIYSFNWILPDGTVAITSDPNTTAASIGDTPYFQQILAGKSSFVSGYQPNEKMSGLQAITLSRAIRDEQDRFQGAIVGVITTREFGDLIPTLQSSRISSILIFDHKGILIYRWPEVNLTSAQRDDWLKSDLVLQAALAGNEATGPFMSPVDNTKEYVARLPVGNTGLIVGVARAESEIINPIIRNIVFNLAIILLIMAVSLLIAGILGRIILSSVWRLREHARAIGKGRLEHRADVGEIAELQELAGEFNQMALQLKDRNARIEQTMTALKHSNEDLEQFAYAVSHDLQEPLRAVSGFTGLLKVRLQSMLDAKTTECMNLITDGVSRMQALIYGLLEFSRISSRGKAIGPVEPKAALERATLNLQAGIKESGAKITSDDLPAVRFDAVQLAQLFQNLIGNAIKFRGESGPEIHIGVVRQDNAWRFSVSDNGIGIEPQYRERIFLIFQRLHTGEKYPGTGIGLALCKKIVERHGGRIWVDSQPGKGSTFYFTVPDNKGD
jgi:signal transduction histidine kinase